MQIKYFEFYCKFYYFYEHLELKWSCEPSIWIIYDRLQNRSKMIEKNNEKKHPITIPLFARDTTSTSWSRNLDSIHFLETLHTIWQIFLHQRCWTTTSRSSPPSEFSQMMKSSVCLTFIGFRRCTKIHINIDSLRVHRSVQTSLYPLYSQNCLHILRKVFRSTARQPTQEVGSIRCGSWRIQKNY